VDNRRAINSTLSRQRSRHPTCGWRLLRALAKLSDGTAPGAGSSRRRVRIAAAAFGVCHSVDVATLEWGVELNLLSRRTFRYLRAYIARWLRQPRPNGRNAPNHCGVRANQCPQRPWECFGHDDDPSARAATAERDRRTRQLPRLRNRCRTGDHTQAGRGQTTGSIGRRCSNQTGAPKTVQRPTRSTPPRIATVCGRPTCSGCCAYRPLPASSGSLGNGEAVRRFRRF